MKPNTLILLGLVAAAAAVLIMRLPSPQPAPAQILAGGEAGGAAARYLTPRSFDADGLSDLFERVARTGGVAHLPAGVYRINRTIKIDGMGPIRIEGESHGIFVRPRGDGFRAQPTRLVWTGEPGGTMLHISGSVGQAFSHIHFDGAGRAGRLVHLTARPGFGTGAQRFDRVLFSNADVAIQAGEREGDFNCADVLYDDVAILACNVGLRVVNHQSVNHFFKWLSVHQVQTAFDFQRGGNLLVDGWQAGTFDLMLRVGYGGPNAGIFRFVSGRPEMNGLTGRYARLAEVEPEDCAQVIFEATQETGGPYDAKLPDNAKDPVFRIGRGGMVVVRNHYHFRPAFELTGPGSYINQDSRWQIPIAQAIPDAARAPAGTIRITGAADPVGVPLPDIRR